VTTTLAIVLTALILPANVVAWALSQYVIPASRAQSALARKYRVHRRHLESLRSWQRRTEAAMDALVGASDAFTTEAQRLGRMGHVPYAGVHWSLPGDHPLAVALLAARYPDGPSRDELAQIMGGPVVEIDADVARAWRRAS